MHVKSTLALTTLMVFVNPPVAADTGGAYAPEVETVRHVVNNYGKALKSTLQQELKRNGTAAAMETCSTAAPSIGSKTSRESGWSIQRISNRARNPLDMPDSYEANVLEEFDRLFNEGAKEAEKYEIVEESGIRYARYMRAISIQPVCLTCHGGSEISETAGDHLREDYPHDRATGYKLGDLRGAFSVKIKLD